MALFAADETRGVGKGIAFDRALVQSMLGGAAFVANARFHFAFLLLLVGDLRRAFVHRMARSPASKADLRSS